MVLCLGLSDKLIVLFKEITPASIVASQQATG